LVHIQFTRRVKSHIVIGLSCIHYISTAHATTTGNLPHLPSTKVHPLCTSWRSPHCSLELVSHPSDQSPFKLSDRHHRHCRYGTKWLRGMSRHHPLPTPSAPRLMVHMGHSPVDMNFQSLIHPFSPDCMLFGGSDKGRWDTFVVCFLQLAGVPGAGRWDRWIENERLD